MLGRGAVDGGSVGLYRRVDRGVGADHSATVHSRWLIWGRMSRFRSIALALALLAGIGLASEGRAQCVSSSEGHRMVSSGQVVPLASALQRAGLSGAQVLAADLCRSGGGWYYQVRYRRGGQVSQANVPAGGY